MSRCDVKPKEGTKAKEVIVGIDPAFQCWFFQVYGDRAPDGEDVMLEWLPRASRGQVIDALEKWADLEDEYTKRVMDNIVLDLDPGEVPLPTEGG